jgi:hypothetical protein
MASSTSDPFSEIPQELKDLFSWNPPRLSTKLRSGKEISTSICRPVPAFFDKHFREDLKLLHVERLPSLVHSFATIVDNAINEYLKIRVELPPSETLRSAERLHYHVLELEWQMADEKAVASFYNKTTVIFCASVASTLALRTPDWTSLLRWTWSANISGYAIADGFLTFASPEDLALKDVQLEEVIDEETLEIFRSLAERDSPLAIWEINNMDSGGGELLLTIPGLSNAEFNWTSATSPQCASMTNYERKGRRVQEVNVRPDAENPPCVIDLCSKDSTSPSHTEDHEEAVRSQHPTLPQTRNITLASTSARTPGFGLPPAQSTNVEARNTLKRKRGNGDNSESMAS